MQDELALMQNGIKELQIMESRLFNVFMLNADAFKKATDIGLSTSAQNSKRSVTGPQNHASQAVCGPTHQRAPHAAL